MQHLHFVNENQKNKSYHKFLHLISETGVTDDHLAKQVSAEEFRAATNFVGTFFVEEHFISDGRNASVET